MYRKILKILATVVGVFLLLAVLAATWIYFNQEAIIKKLRESVETSINGKFDIGGFQFKPFGRQPGLTFLLRDIHLSDSLYENHNKPFTEISRLEVTLGLETLLNMNVSIRNLHIRDGSIFIFTRRDGYSNFSLFRSGRKEPGKSNVHISRLFGKVRSLQLTNVSFTYSDSLKEKYYSAIMKRVSGSYGAAGNGWEGKLTGPVSMDSLVFNSKKGAFLRNRDIHLSALVGFNEKTRIFSFFPETYIQLGDHERIDISGDLSTGEPHGPMELHFHTNRIRVPVATSILADTIAAKINRIGIDTYVSADVSVKGNMGDKQPWVEVGFKTDTFSYKTPVGYFRGLKTGGSFTNRADTLLRPGNANSRIKSGRITGFFEKVPVKGSLRISDLTNPLAGIVLHAKIDSTGLNSLLDTDRYLAMGGMINLDMRFNGRLKNLYDPQNDRLDGKLDGKARVSNLKVAYLPRKIMLSQVESNISISQDEIIIHQLDLSDNQNQLHIKGKISRYLHLILGSPKPAKAAIDINIPEWRLNWIEVLVSEESKRNRKSSKKFTEIVDRLVDNLEIQANLKAGTLNYHNFRARNVTGKLNMSQNTTSIEPLSLDAFGGRVTVSGQLKSPDQDKSFAVLNATGKVTNANVSNILYSFKDFGQKALSSKNVKGQLDIDFNFSSQVNPDVSLVPKSMNGYLDMHFTKGQLIDFEPFLKMKKLIFKNRPLENVKIAPIRKRFSLKGQEVRIQKMQIESNVLTLFVEGQYSFGDKTDLSIQFPLKNLKKRDEEYEFQTYDSEELRSIFLRAVEENGEVNIKLDSRKKARKRAYPDSTNTPKDSTLLK